MSRPENHPLALTIATAAALLGVSEETVEDLVRTKRIYSSTVDGAPGVDLDSLNGYIARHQEATTS